MQKDRFSLEQNHFCDISYLQWHFTVCWYICYSWNFSQFVILTCNPVIV